MRILLACEYSGVIRDAFIAEGHDVTSCDLNETERPGPHYKGDVRDIIDQDWDAVFAHPDCTYLTNAGVRWLYEDCRATTASRRWELIHEAVEFFNLFANHPARFKYIENPIPHGHAGLPAYTQTIQPYDFYPETTSKRTCLWLYGLPPLVPTQLLDKTSRTYEVHTASPGPNRWKDRSRSFPGIASAMAKQWSLYWRDPETHDFLYGN